MDKANKKYRKDKVSIQIFTNHNLKRDFQMACMYRGLKMKYVLEKLMSDYAKNSGSKLFS